LNSQGIPLSDLHTSWGKCWGRDVIDKTGLSGNSMSSSTGRRSLARVAAGRSAGHPRMTRRKRRCERSVHFYSTAGAAWAAARGGKGPVKGVRGGHIARPSETEGARLQKGARLLVAAPVRGGAVTRASSSRVTTEGCRYRARAVDSGACGDERHTLTDARAVYVFLELADGTMGRARGGCSFPHGAARGAVAAGAPRSSMGNCTWRTRAELARLSVQSVRPMRARRCAPRRGQGTRRRAAEAGPA